MAAKTERFTGALTKWNDQRGFGFVPLEGGPDVFVHISSLAPGFARPAVGETITFGVDVAADGRRSATQVRTAHRELSARTRRAISRRASSVVSIVAFVAFVAIFVIVLLVFGLPLWVPVVYIGASVAAAAFYLTDKVASINGQYRIRESSLLMLSLVGGWPGAIVAQEVLRHKTAKIAYRKIFWACVLANVLLFVALATPAISWIAEQYNDL